MTTPSHAVTEMWRRRDSVSPAPTTSACEVPIVAVDVETTGRSVPHGHRIRELALLGHDLVELVVAVDHDDEDQASFGDFAGEIVDRLTHGVVVGHNVLFDLEFIASEFDRLADFEMPDVIFVDTLALARDTMDEAPERWTLSSVAEQLGVTADGELHTARTDATLALEIFDALAERLDTPTLGELGLGRLSSKGGR